jgi:hypothetical protein
MKKTFIWITMVLVSLCLGLTGCKSTKDITKQATVADYKKLDGFLHQGTAFRQMDAKVEFRFNVKTGVGASMKGNIRLNKDSCVIISIQPFAGYEAVKCLIVKDSMIIVSRLHQVYSVERLDQFAYKEFVNISAVQDILTNRIFVPGDANPDERKLARFSRYRQKEEEGYRWAEDSFILDFLFNKEKQYSTLKAFRPERNQAIIVTYSQFKEVPFGAFPHLVDFTMNGFKTNVSLQINYLKPLFDTSTDFRFEVPSKYKKVTTSELIKRFQNLL